ncbi:MAG TPA: UDP-N-acetylmuramoyl-L-alanine--D-glutamate ligase [Sphingomonas sp.]|uniref:UDP-N-acetylmuramoyl-L-alanine--D-glutamate ligase n=1 Tax=Sphingomonas sp. TaxID=28214 RepID=UPI002C19F8D0|nr:UDP-N-acetylmuramoyl-L-alanine--D-glutamate ligase [Sphingomonas sp.]HMI20181.1 UDP-N-acetylmuramoyl-L-alanine--D-glutamate ligase [Sphingomonas sp.]
MITSPTFRGKRYIVLGLARSGVATVEALLASGAEVVAWDSREEARDAVSGVTFADPLEIDLAGFDGVVVSPGVPLNKHPIAAHARKANVPVIGDIELFALARSSLPPHKVVGITGTNGKSTTTALIHHILETAGVPTLMGGNIGLPILSQNPLPEGGVYVLELSSYQIDLTFSLDCDVAVLTNITPDHLDRYDGFEDYTASKLRLFSMQAPLHDAVVGEPHLGERWLAPLIPNTNLWLALDYRDRQANWPALQGPHNHQNAACAIATCEALGLAEGVIEQGLRTYPGLPHRMERVAEKGGVLYVNDSKATNATATAPALAAYPKIHWILGGIPKTDDLDDCAPFFGHVRAGYTIGQAGPMFANILRIAGKPVTESGTLAQAVNDAAAAAQPGEVVMLSPACASFDQFKDYEARGDAFRAAVGAL